MAQNFKTATKFSGLVTYPNSLSEVPAGALQLASNVVVDRPGSISPRRGQRVYNAYNRFGDLSIATRLFQVASKLFGLYTSDGLPVSTGDLVRVDADAVTPPTAAATSVTQPPANAMHSFEENSNVYLTTGDGILKLQPLLVGSSSGTSVPAGMPAGLDIQASTEAPAAGLGFLAGGNATAYRAVFGSTDAAGNLVLGAPTSPVIVQNPVIADVAQPLPGPVPTALGPSSAVFSVNLGYTAGATKIYNSVYVVQGSTVLKGNLYTTATSAQGIIKLTETVQYFGPSGTSLTVVIPVAATSVTTSTTLVCPALDTAGLSAASLYTAYTPFNSIAPASTAGASLTAVVTALPSATSFTVGSGVWTAGSVGLVLPVTVAAAQLNTVLFNTGSYVFKVSDNVAFPGVTEQLTVTAFAINVGSSGFDVLTLDTFPAGLTFTGGDYVSVYRPQNVQVTFTVPKEVLTYIAAGLATFCQLYRSFVQLPLVSGQSPSPTDNMQLAFQKTLTGTPTQVVIHDIAPDGTLGTDLYTSPRQQGILQAKYQPPVASDACLYQGSALYADCWLPATFSSALLGVSATTNASLGALQPGDVITINGTTFTAHVGAPGAGQFQIFTGSGSVTQDIQSTVAGLSRIVNQAFIAPTSAGTAAETVNLLAIPDTTTFGGQFTIQTSRGLGTFTLAYTPIGGHPSPFSNPLTGTIAPSQQQNALYYSPQGEPEAVPLLNSKQVGQANTPILRVLPLPNSAIIFKPEGIYQLTGTSPDQFSISLFNTTAQLLSNESAVLLQSTVIAFTNQGVITVSQSGVQITSMAINDTLRALTALPAFASTSFGVAHETERRYILWTPTTADDTLPTQAFTYNILTNSWSVWPMARVCGLVNRTDQLLYTGTVNNLSTVKPGMYVETAPGAAYGYGDDVSTGTINVLSSTTVRFVVASPSDAATVVANFVPGSALLTVSGTVVYPTAAVLSAEEVIFTVPSTAFLVEEDAVTYYQGYVCQFAPVPIAGDDPGSVKQFQEFEFQFVNTNCPNVTATCASDFNADYTALSLGLIGLGGLPDSGYGSGPWGNFPWGLGAPAVPLYTRNARQLVRGATRGHYFWPTVTATVAANTFNVQGMTLAWTPVRSLRSR